MGQPLNKTSKPAPLLTKGGEKGPGVEGFEKTLTQLATAGLNEVMGADYNSRTGGYDYKDSKEATQHYSGSLNHFHSFIGGLAANLTATYAGNALLDAYGSSWGVDSDTRFSTTATILSGNDLVKLFGKTDGGDPNSVWEKMRTETLTQGVLSFGIAGQDAGKIQAGGGNVDFSLSNLSEVASGLHAFAFHVGTEEETRTLVNQSLIYGNDAMKKIAMDVYDFDKSVSYDLDESKGEIGHADKDGRTIHLSSDMQKELLSDSMDIAKSLSTFGREGILLDLHNDSGNSNWSNKDFELAATQMQTNMIDTLKAQGINFSEKDQWLEKALYESAETGEAGIFDWSGGRDAKIRNNGILEIEDHDYRESRITANKEKVEAILGTMSEKDMLLFMSALHLASGKTGDEQVGFGLALMGNLDMTKEEDRNQLGQVIQLYTQFQLLNKDFIDKLPLTSGSGIVYSQEGKDKIDKYVSDFGVLNPLLDVDLNEKMSALDLPDNENLVARLINQTSNFMLAMGITQNVMSALYNRAVQNAVAKRSLGQQAGTLNEEILRMVKDGYKFDLQYFAKDGGGNLPVLRNDYYIGKHTLDRMSERGISESMIDKAIKKGNVYYDFKNSSYSFVLENGFASGKTLQVGQNPVTRKITTVMRKSNFNPYVKWEGNLRYKRIK